jgi:hypothetical protein
MAYSGRFVPTNPKKYLGNPTTIWYRSLWERRVMVHLDTNTSVLEWSSEEIVIPYLSPVDNRIHRYFPDFFVRTNTGAVILEVKPHNQSVMPEKKAKRTTKRYLTEVMTYGVNQAKWKAAEEYCLDRGWKFKVITEKELFGK